MSSDGQGSVSPAGGASDNRGEKSKRSGNLKHDLRTPLNHIIGYCEMLLEESAEAQPQLVADLERIHLAGRRLLMVINDLFDPIKSAAYKADPSLVHHEIRTPLN